MIENKLEIQLHVIQFGEKIKMSLQLYMEHNIWFTELQIERKRKLSVNGEQMDDGND